MVDQAVPQFFEFECNSFVSAVRALDQARGSAEVADPDRTGLILVNAFAHIEGGLGIEALYRLMGWIQSGLAQLTDGGE